MSIDIFEIRCPGERGHKVSNGDYQTEYTTCGSLLGGIKEESEAIFRCPICKKFWRAYYDENNMLVLEGVDKGSRIGFGKCVRRIKNATDDE